MNKKGFKFLLLAIGLITVIIILSGCMTSAFTYSVSGYVTYNGNGLSGVTISFSDGLSSVMTNSQGYWSQSDLSGNVTITPSLTGYAFSPSNITVDGSSNNVNFVAALTYSVSGYVTYNGNGLSGVTISFSDGLSSVITNSKGYWSQSGLSGNVTITPSLTGYTFSPLNITVDGSSNNVDFTGTYFIGGYVMYNGTGLSGVTMSFSNGSSPVITNSQGYWSQNSLVGTVTVTPSLTGYTFNPSSITLNGPNNDVNFYASQIVAGTLQWYYSTNGSISTSSPAVGSDGTIYIGSTDGYLYAINPNGTLKWNFETDGWITSSPVIGPDGTVYVGSEVGYSGSHDGNLYAINPTTGNVEWTYTVSHYCWACLPSHGGISSTPVIGTDGTIYVGGENGDVCAINPDGTLKWEYQTNQYLLSSLVISSNGTIYVGTGDLYNGGALYAINSANGHVIWECTLPTGGVGPSNPAIGSDGTIYVGSICGGLYAVNPTNGTIEWGDTSIGWVQSSPVIGKDGTIYVGSDFNGLYAINPNGVIRWNFNPGGGDSVYSTPAIGEDGTIYFGDDSGNFYALNPNGTLKWEYTVITGGAISSSPAISSDGTIYFGDADNNLYAISSSSFGLENSPCPMFHCNLEHTGQSMY